MLHNPHRAGGNRFYIAEQAIAGKTQGECFNALRPMVESQTLVFKRNATRQEKAMGITQRQPLATIALQLKSLRDEIGRVYHNLGLAKSKRFQDRPEIIETPDEIPTPEDTPEDVPTPEIQEDIPEIPEPEEAPIFRPIAKGKRKMIDELLYYRKRLEEIRVECMRRDEQKAGIDWISIRTKEAGNKLIPLGIPADALLYTAARAWSPESREQFGIPEFDMESLSREIMEKRGITEIVRKDEDGNSYSEVPHVMFGYVLVLAEVRQPIMLVGEYGTSKSYMCHQLADFMGVPYSETPMSLGATRGDLLGRYTANPDQYFIAAKFDEIYGAGGIFNFEEFDAGDPGLLIVLNNALAGNHFYNSNSGQNVNRSPNFIAMATANTMCDGANRRYVGRVKLDAATVDRWRMGRVWIGVDQKVEDSVLFKGIDFDLNSLYI